MHGDDRVDRVSRRDETTKVGAVLVVHPAVGDDEAEYAIRLQYSESHLDEAHEDVAASTHRGARSPIRSAAGGRHVLQTNVGGITQHEVSDVFAVGREEEVATLDAVRGDRLRLDVVEPRFDQCASDGLLCELSVHGEQIEGAQRCPNVGKRATVNSARLDETLGHRSQERTRPTRGFDSDHVAEITIGREAGQIEDQLDDPATSEHFAVLTCLVDLEHVWVYFLPQVEAELSFSVPVDPGHRAPPNYSSSIGVHWNRA